MPIQKFLSPTIQRKNSKKIYGFDIETADDNKTFVCGSLYLNENQRYFFWEKDHMIQALKQKKFGNSYIVATNLAFDFLGTFFGTDEMKHFNLLMSGSSMLSASTYIKNKKFTKLPNKAKINFIDTMNFAKMSVEDMGKILKIPKLKKPVALGKVPKNEEERTELMRYNLRDSMISKLFFEFLLKGFETIGASMKITISSTSMNLFKSKYLDRNYQVLPKDWLLDILEGYYGGRTEVFKRGYIEDLNYYDINSLYPSVMLNKFPDPNTMRVTRKNDYRYIKNFEGMSSVDIFCPDMQHPMLPTRIEKKLVFPTGNISGWYTHIELREAVKRGYVIKKIHKIYYSVTTCMPFNNFVTDLYKQRLQYKKEGSLMELVIKLALNSLYGKFGQHFMDVDELRYMDISFEELMKYKDIDRYGEFFRLKKDVEPHSFSQPLWSAYVTAYGRIKLQEYIEKYDACYCDTDSIFTKQTMPTSDALGDMKLESKIDFAYIVRPKMYYFKLGAETVTRIKGLPLKQILGTGLSADGKSFEREESLVKEDETGTMNMWLSKEEFRRILLDGALYNKFVKFKESLRRKLIPNEIIQVYKQLNLEDTKRVWNTPFSFENVQESQPIKI